MTKDAVYRYLIYFYLDEISDWRFERDMREADIGERAYLSHHFASRIPGDQDYEIIMRKISELMAAD